MENKPMGQKMFTNHAAKMRFVDLYEMLTAKQQEVFGECLRVKFDTKIVSLDDLDDFYITVKDVDNCFREMQEKIV